MSPDVPEMIDGWTLYVCPNGHVATSTLNLACWACYPGGRDALPTQKPVEVVPRSALDRQARETACDRCGDELRDHPGLRPVCGVCMLGTTEDDLYQQARRDVAREIVEALRAEARGRTPHADRDARVIAGIREGADLIEHVFLSPDNPEGNA